MNGMNPDNISVIINKLTNLWWFFKLKPPDFYSQIHNKQFTYTLPCNSIYATIKELMLMKLYYRVKPEEFRACMDRIRDNYGMHEEVDETRTVLKLEDEDLIERVIGTFDPDAGEVHIRVILGDNSLKEFFDSVLGMPYKIK